MGGGSGDLGLGAVRIWYTRSPDFPHVKHRKCRKAAGTIEPGKFADIIAVTGDPLADISVLEKVGFVMKGGVVVGGKPDARN